jgi:hypothetical protein
LRKEKGFGDHKEEKGIKLGDMSRPWGWIEKEKKLQENGSGAWSRGGGRLTGRGDRHHAIRRHIAKVAIEAVAPRAASSPWPNG